MYRSMTDRVSNLPPGPSLPPLLQTLYISLNPIAFLDQCQQRYGDTFTLRVLGPGSPPIVFLSHPDSVQAVFTTLSDRLSLGKVAHVFRPLTGNQSLIMQNGDRHQHQRQLLMPPLHGNQLQRYGELIQQITQEAIADWQVGDRLSIRPTMSRVSLAVILRVVFGIQPGRRYQDLETRLEQLLEAITSTLYSTQFFFPLLQQNWGRWSPWGSFLEQRAAIDRLIYAEIAERRSQHTPSTDVLSLLLSARDEQGQPLSDAELRDQLMTLLLLGHETTASALAWAVYWVHQEASVRSHLLQELDGVTDAEAIAQLPYLTAVCREALRVYPIALIAQPRRVEQAVELEGYDFQPGAVLVPCIFTAHRRSQAYPQPQQFNPDHFRDRKSPYEFFPFGGGSRSCIGMALALYEMKLALATVLQAYDLSDASLGTVQPQRRGITFVPSDRTFRLRVNGSRPLPPRCPAAIAPNA
jgi:cytochrome P450 family 110